MRNVCLSREWLNSRICFCIKLLQVASVEGDEENLVLGSSKNWRPSETSWGPAGNLWPPLKAAELDQEACRVLKAERIANMPKQRARRFTSGLWCRASRDPSARGRSVPPSPAILGPMSRS